MFCKIIVASISILLLAVLSTVDTVPKVYLVGLLDKSGDKITKNRRKHIPIQLRANLIPRPRGFKSPKNWTTDSVIRLLDLIKADEETAPLQQALKPMLAYSAAPGSSEIKVRGMEQRASDTVLTIDNHLELGLPSAQIGLDTVKNLILPSKIQKWLKRMTTDSSEITSPVKGRGVGAEDAGGSEEWRDVKKGADTRVMSSGWWSDETDTWIGVVPSTWWWWHYVPVTYVTTKPVYDGWYTPKRPKHPKRPSGYSWSGWWVGSSRPGSGGTHKEGYYGSSRPDRRRYPGRNGLSGRPYGSPPGSPGPSVRPGRPARPKRT